MTPEDIDLLKRLKQLLDDGIFTQEEFDKQKALILNPTPIDQKDQGMNSREEVAQVIRPYASVTRTEQEQQNMQAPDSPWRGFRPRYQSEEFNPSNLTSTENKKSFLGKLQDRYASMSSKTKLFSAAIATTMVLTTCVVYAVNNQVPSEIEFGPWADLSGKNLSGKDLSGLDLSGSNLSGADLSEANLSNVNLRGADLSSADLSWANLKGADLSFAVLEGAKFFGAEMVLTNLIGAKGDYSLVNAHVISPTTTSVTTSTAPTTTVVAMTVPIVPDSTPLWLKNTSGLDEVIVDQVRSKLSLNSNSAIPDNQIVSIAKGVCIALSQGNIGLVRDELNKARDSGTFESWVALSWNVFLAATYCGNEFKDEFVELYPEFALN
jgi:hypothetical protein